MYSRYLQYISLSLSLSLRGCGVVGPYAVVAWARSMMTHVRHFERPVGNAREYFEYEHDVDYFPHDHRMAMQNCDYRRAHEVKFGDYLCTSDGECEVIATREVSDETPVFEIYFQEDRSVFMVCCDDVSANVAAFGSEQSVPYDPEDFVEFRFKGQICTTMGSAETWLNDTFKCKLDGFGL